MVASQYTPAYYEKFVNYDRKKFHTIDSKLHMQNI